MKKFFTNIICASLVLTISSCEDFLNIESKTDITSNYLSSTPEGLSRAVIGLYNLERGFTDGDESNLYVATMCDYSTDISVYRGGTSAALARLNTLLPNNPDVEKFWQHYYFIIGKANEIIAGAENIGLENETVKRAWGEAKFFRGRSYFELWKKFERLYLNTAPTTVDNLEREFKPASKEDVFNTIRTDLDDAINALEWEIPNNDYGRVSKATAKHVRAQFAMWENDYDKAITECEDIFNDGTYHLLSKTSEVFKDQNLRSPEVLWSYQFSENLGGGGTGTPLVGHRISVNTTTRYQANSGCVFEAAQGGYGWGRIYPNSYLFSLYDTEKDNRYKEMFIHTFYYNDKNSSKYGQPIPKDLYGKSAGYIEKIHPMSKKHFDQWTNADQPDRSSSFRDLIIYRLAETSLICCEAYFHRDGGNSPEAIKYYNKTWERAGNSKENGPLTLDMIVDEYARELNFEGVRWPLLKRLGILAERVHLHGGDLKTEDQYLDKDFAECREFFITGKHETWPIPQNQIDLMGTDNFPQSDPWK